MVGYNVNPNLHSVCTEQRTITITCKLCEAHAEFTTRDLTLEHMLTDKDKTITGVPVLDRCAGENCLVNDLDLSARLFLDLFADLPVPPNSEDVSGYGRVPGDKPDLGHATWSWE